MESNLKRITAILGPTNTGKTHLAVETMLEHESGIMGFPLRLLAREVFDKCVDIGPYKHQKKVSKNSVVGKNFTGHALFLPYAVI